MAKPQFAQDAYSTDPEVIAEWKREHRAYLLRQPLLLIAAPIAVIGIVLYLIGKCLGPLGRVTFIPLSYAFLLPAAFAVGWTQTGVFILDDLIHPGLRHRDQSSASAVK